jgi:hypothetical protein
MGEWYRQNTQNGEKSGIAAELKTEERNGVTINLKMGQVMVLPLRYNGLGNGITIKAETDQNMACHFCYDGAKYGYHKT